jgi:FAD/FMN-containing dehydrogenase
VTISSHAVAVSSSAELAQLLAAHHAAGKELHSVDLRAMSRVLELTPEDMTVTVESGVALGELQRELAAHRQWLSVDPPNAESVSIHEILAKDLSGPRRFGYGTIREHLIGMKVALADGRIIKSGGKVVKNVAGYDLAKLFIGARNSLGIIVEATFKVRPLPEIERIVSKQLALADANKTLRAVLDSDLMPVILDVHRLADASDLSLVLGVAGTRAEVEWQLGLARSLGFASEATLDYETSFWSDAAPVNRIAVLPLRLTEAITELGSRPFVARAGNGVIYYRGEMISQKRNLPIELMQRIKAAGDPKNILPELTA